jgi:hypothetical protein
MASRTPREIETRADEERVEYTPPDQLPQPRPEPGYVFRWIATHVLGEASGRNVSQKFRDGWVPAKAADHPEMNDLANKEGNIEVGGLMLCKNTEEQVEARRRFYANKNLQQMQSVDEQFMAQNNPLMPKFRKVKSTVTRGRGFGNGS